MCLSSPATAYGTRPALRSVSASASKSGRARPSSARIPGLRPIFWSPLPQALALGQKSNAAPASLASAWVRAGVHTTCRCPKESRAQLPGGRMQGGGESDRGPPSAQGAAHRLARARTRASSAGSIHWRGCPSREPRAGSRRSSANQAAEQLAAWHSVLAPRPSCGRA